MTYRSLYDQYLTELQHIYTKNECSIIADRVFESLASVRKADLIINKEMVVDAQTAGVLIEALEKLQAHVPYQQVIGKAWFHGLEFHVTEAVLIPRPETEELVELAIECIGDKHSTVIDIGTGSGCIPISIKSKLPQTTVTAIDVSADALEIAMTNARHHHCAIDLLQLDFLNEEEWKRIGEYDLIISNPPYIPIQEKDSMDKNVVAYEPHLALFVDNNDPLLFYKKIAQFGKIHLKAKGHIMVEIHENLGEDTKTLFEKYYSDVVIKKDIFGKDRFVIAKR